MIQKMLLNNVDTTVRFGITGYARSEQAKEMFYYLSEFTELREWETVKQLENHLLNQSIVSLPDVLLIEVDECEECFAMIEKFQKNILLKGMIIVLLSDH